MGGDGQDDGHEEDEILHPAGRVCAASEGGKPPHRWRCLQPGQVVAVKPHGSQEAKGHMHPLHHASLLLKRGVEQESHHNYPEHGQNALSVCASDFPHYGWEGQNKEGAISDEVVGGGWWRNTRV